jgi:putative tryptophan/tyrosine transport system substrate-binding protein
VFQTGVDPVEEGLVTRMNRPGGNITGVSRMTVATDPKRLELLHNVVPNVTVIGCLVNPTSPRSGSQVRQIEDSAHTFGLELRIIKASTVHELETVFTTLPQTGAAALLLVPDPAIVSMYEQIAKLARNPAIFRSSNRPSSSLSSTSKRRRRSASPCQISYSHLPTR